MRSASLAFGFRLILASTAFAALAASTALAEDPPLFKQIDPLIKELSAITGLAPLKKVQPAFIHRDQLKAFLEERLKDAVKPEEIRAEELTLKKFGLVPQDFDLAKNTVELLTEQAAAFYDYDKKKLFITDSTPSETQEPVLAHELSHAIADQNYNLAKFIHAGHKSDDGSTARLAVMEGQATWLMSEYLARKMGQSLKGSPALVSMMSNMSGDGM